MKPSYFKLYKCISSLFSLLSISLTNNKNCCDNFLKLSAFSLALIELLKLIINTLTLFTIILGNLTSLASVVILFNSAITDDVRIKGILNINLILLQYILARLQVSDNASAFDFNVLIFVFISISNNIIYKNKLVT
jgi:hypothetical protein